MMTRKTPNVPVPEVKPVERDDYITQIRKYKVITPLYGGGEEPAQADSITVVRGTEVRGHLRFWWRATRGGAFGGNLEKMKRREEEIWGSPGGKGKPGPSKVTITVVNTSSGKIVTRVKNIKGQLVYYGDPGSPYGYVAFPLRKTDDHPAGSVREDVEFSIEIKYPKDSTDDVLAALWGWETFGGIGARTRRGFGAIQCMSIDNQSVSPKLSHDIEKNIREDLKPYQGNWPKGVPHLSTNLRFVITPAKSSPSQAWETLFNALHNFRQKDARYSKKTGNKSAFGMSRWPEANAIRDAFGLSPQFPAGVPNVLIKKFPRAAFGLPIGFEMHHDKSIEERPELQGANHDRLASPLILRPLACAGDKAVGLVAILDWELIDSDELYTPPGGLVLKDAPDNPKVQSSIKPAEAKQIPVLNGKTDVLQAFLDYLKGT